jgi:hypothetical protein
MSFLRRLFGRTRTPAAQPAGASAAGAFCSEAAAELAGFFAAHAVWCISDGEVLIPLAGSETADGQRKLIRFEADRLEKGVAAGQKWLAENPDAAARGVLIFDGFITTRERKRADALLAMARDFSRGDAPATWAIPYRPAADPAGFAVERPQLLADPAAGEAPKLAEAFWRGVRAHEKGAPVWDQHLHELR